MCYHKSLVQKYNDLMDHYSASFNSITEELEPIKERFSIMMSRDSKSEPYSKQETQELTWLQKTLNSFTDTEFKRYHENGFDFLPTPIITAGAPEEFKLFRWGLIPFYMSDKEKAMALRVSTLNCISEEMYDKQSFKDAAKNGQRCLIPTSGFYEWRWLDEKGKVKIPYYVSLKERPLVSMAGLYSRWKDKTTDQYYYTYTVLTTTANPMMEYVHNNKKRMPVIIPREFEKDWLNKNLSKDDVLALCQPFKNEAMRAHTVSKLITTKNTETNVDEVLKLHNYEKVGTDEIVAQLE
jgi:putative SOS response-associated peptidase YedK